MRKAIQAMADIIAFITITWMIILGLVMAKTEYGEIRVR